MYSRESRKSSLDRQKINALCICMLQGARRLYGTSFPFSVTHSTCTTCSELLTTRNRAGRVVASFQLCMPRGMSPSGDASRPLTLVLSSDTTCRLINYKFLISRKFCDSACMRLGRPSPCRGRLHRQGCSVDGSTMLIVRDWCWPELQGLGISSKRPSSS